jgi:hypothetical protein
MSGFVVILTRKFGVRSIWTKQGVWARKGKGEPYIFKSKQEIEDEFYSNSHTKDSWVFVKGQVKVESINDVECE